MPYHRPDASYEERIAAAIASLRVIVSFMAAAVVISVGIAAYGFIKADDAISANRQTIQYQATLARREAALAQQSATEAKLIVLAQKQSREMNIKDLCEQQNVANARVDSYLIKITPLRRRHATPHFLQVVQKLADAFDPVHPNCTAYAQQQVNAQ